MSIAIYQVYSVRAVSFRRHQGGRPFLHVSAQGFARTDGWSDFALQPRFPLAPPMDGVMEFDFVGDPPAGQVLQVVSPASAYHTMGLPDWATAVRVHAEDAFIEQEIGAGVVIDVPAPISAPAPAGFAPAGVSAYRHVVLREVIARFEDSWQVIGSCGGFSIRMKKLVHELTLIVEGPDESRARACFEQAAGVGLIAAIVAVFATGGGALSAAIAAFIGHLQQCLGDSFSVRVEDRSRWVTWCT